MSVEKKKRIRLSPEERKIDILNHTARIVAESGVSSVTMESVSKEVGISKSLMYSYYPTTTELLRALYSREMRKLRKLQNQAALEASTLEQLVRKVTNVYLNYIEKNGLLINRLQSEPSVHELGGPSYFGKEEAAMFLAEIISKSFNIPMEITIPVVDISFGLPDAAGRYLEEKGADKQFIEDITVTMILGSISAIKDEFDFRFKPIR